MSAETALRVVVADDQRAVREALVTLLETMGEVEVVAACADGEEAVEAVERHHPAVVLMDLRMPKVDGVEATRRIMAGNQPPRVVVLTTFADDVSVLGALDAGAAGYLTKDAGRDQIAAALRAAAAGQAVLDPDIQARLVAAARTAPPAGHAANPPTGALPDGLTAREAEIVRSIAAGRTNAEIARELYIAEATVKTHINNVFAKAGLRSRAEAVNYAHRHGLTDP